MRYLLMLSLVFGIVSCDGLANRQLNRSSETAVSVEEYGTLFLNTETRELLDFKPCGDGFKEECEVFKDQFQTVAVRQIVVIDSIRKDNTTCCRTIIIGGTKIQYCKDFGESITTCPPGWYN